MTEASSSRERPVVLLAGNPNAGKTTLFNRLAGTKARTGNYPGITVERRSASIGYAGRQLDVVDVPGTYSLSSRSPEEEIAVHEVLREAPDAVVVVVDATALTRGLYLAVQVLEAGIPTVVALNMIDDARKLGISPDLERLREELGAPVVAIAATSGEGAEELEGAVAKVLSTAAPTALLIDYGETEPLLADLERAVRTAYDVRGARARTLALWALLSLGDDELEDVPDALRAAVVSTRAEAEAAAADIDASIVGARYRFVDHAVGPQHATQIPPRRPSDRVDAVLTHPLWGTLAFAGVMYLVFEGLFTGSEPAMGLVEDTIGWAQELVLASMSAGALRDLLVSGVIAGVGNVVVFVPQIAFLSFLIAFMEDSGYLARAAFLIDRVMKSVGLHGHAFVPLLSGFACAVPAVMATRTLSSRRDRVLTMMALPLMSCSARLPVYVLVIATVFSGSARVFGVLSAGAVALFSMYALSVVGTLGAAAVMRRTVLKGPRPPLLLELPPYRMPQLGNLLGVTGRRTWAFLKDAGTIILALTIVLWALLNYPKDEMVVAEADAARSEATSSLEGEALEARISEIEQAESARLLERSFAGQTAKAIEPILEPIGMDWRLGIGVLGSFAAREVFVSTLGMVFGVGEVDEEDEGLRARLRAATWPDGRPLVTPVSGIALMVFFVFAAQCMSTLAIVKREAGGWKWAVGMFGYMTVLAYVAALVVMQVGGLFVGSG